MNTTEKEKILKKFILNVANFSKQYKLDGQGYTIKILHDVLGISAYVRYVFNTLWNATEYTNSNSSSYWNSNGYVTTTLPSNINMNDALNFSDIQYSNAQHSKKKFKTCINDFVTNFVHQTSKNIPSSRYKYMDNINQFAINHRDKLDDKLRPNHDFHIAIVITIILFLISCAIPNVTIDNTCNFALIATKGFGYFLMLSIKQLINFASIFRLILNLVVDIPMWVHVCRKHKTLEN